MESNSENSPLKRYSLKSAAVLVFLSVLFAAGKVLSMVPFLDEFSFLGALPLTDFISALLGLLAVAALIRYAIDSSVEFEQICIWLPSASRPYRFLMYFLLTVFSYYAFYPLASAFLPDWLLLSYKLIFTGLVLWLAASEGLYFYVNRNEIGARILGLAGRIKI